MSHRYLLSVPGTETVPTIAPGTLPWLETLMKHALKFSPEFPGALWFIEKREKDQEATIIRVFRNGKDITKEWQDSSA